MQPFVKNVGVLYLGSQQRVILLLYLLGVWMMILGLGQISLFFGMTELSGIRVSNQIIERLVACLGVYSRPSQRLILGADSSGHRNTLAEPLSRCFIFECLSGTLVELPCYRI